MGETTLVVLFIILGNLGILLHWRFLIRLKRELPQAWDEVGRPGVLETLAPSRLGDHLAWRRTLSKFNAPRAIRRLLTLSEVTGALAFACWIWLAVVLLRAI